MRERIPDYRLEPPAPKPIPACPYCGKECDTVYLDADGDIVGCDQCISMADAYDYLYEDVDS